MGRKISIKSYQRTHQPETTVYMLCIDNIPIQELSKANAIIEMFREVSITPLID